MPRVYLARHGETEWSATGQHTGRTDLPLTSGGEREAVELGQRLAETAFDRVLSSPLVRAWRTCELAGFGDRAEADPELVEMDYGDFEGRTTDEIRRTHPGWNAFRDGCPGGESIAAITARADRVIARLRKINQGKLLLFSHRHFLQFLAARWVGLPGEEGRRLLLSTASLSILSFHHTLDEPVIELWNAAPRAAS